MTALCRWCPWRWGPSDAKVSVQNTHPDDDVEMMDYCPQSGGPGAF